MGRVVYTIVNDTEVIPQGEEDQRQLANFYANLGALLRTAREAAQLTQTKLAERVGLSPAAINNYEAGIRQIPVHLLLDFAQMLGKPLQYFFGPHTEPAFLIQDTLKSAIERFTDAAYISSFLELHDGLLVGADRPEPLIPLPPEIARDHHFALRTLDERTGAHNYYLFKWYKPRVKVTGAFIFRRLVEEYVPPEPDDWVLATVGDTTRLESVKYRDVTPSALPGIADRRGIQVVAIMVSRVERLVKPE